MALALVSTEYRPSQECPSQQSSVEDLELKVQYTDEDGCHRPRQAIGEGAPGGSRRSAHRERVNLHITELISGVTQSFRGTREDARGAAKWVA